MSSRRSRSFIAGFALVLAAGLATDARLIQPATAPAQPQPAAPATPAPDTANLPSAKEITDKYIAATGGREAYEKLNSRVTSSTLTVVGVDIKGIIKTYMKAPNLIHIVSEVANVEKSIQTYDGTHAWSTSTNTGPHLLTDDELTELLRQATFNSEIYPEKLYKTIEVIAREEVDGKPAYKVVFTPEKGSPVTNFYDAESGLLVKIAVSAKGPMGKVDSETTLSDYKPVDSVLLPHQADVRIKGQPFQIKLVTDKIEHNVEIDPAMFKPPADIQKLIDKKGAAPEAPAAKPATPDNNPDKR